MNKEIDTIKQVLADLTSRIETVEKIVAKSEAIRIRKDHQELINRSQKNSTGGW